MKKSFLTKSLCAMHIFFIFMAFFAFTTVANAAEEVCDACTATTETTGYDRTGWVASTNLTSGDTNANYVIDGDINTRWGGNQSNSVSRYIQLDMREPKYFTEIVLSTKDNNDYACGFTVSGSNDGINFTDILVCPQGNGAMYHTRDATNGSFRGQIVSLLSQQYYRYIRVTSQANGTGGCDGVGGNWSVNEFYVLNLPLANCAQLCPYNNDVCFIEGFEKLLNVTANNNCPTAATPTVPTPVIAGGQAAALKTYNQNGNDSYCNITGGYTLILPTGNWTGNRVGRVEPGRTGGICVGIGQNNGYLQLPALGGTPDTLIFWVRVPNASDTNAGRGFQVLLNGLATQTAYYSTTNTRGTLLPVSNTAPAISSSGYFRFAANTWYRITVPLQASTTTIRFQTGDNDSRSITFIDDIIIKCKLTCTAPTSATVSGAQSHCQGVPATPLTATASGGSPTTYTYQWYSNTVNSNTGGKLIPNAVGNSYTPPTATAGTTYYYVVAFTGDAKCTINSDAFAVEVKPAPSLAVTYNSGVISWTAPAGISGYNIYSCNNKDCSSRTKVNSTPLPAASVSYSLSTPPDGLYYVVEALFTNTCTSLSNQVLYKKIPSQWGTPQTSFTYNAGCDKMVGYVDFSHKDGIETGRWSINDIKYYGQATQNITLASNVNYQSAGDLVTVGNYAIVKNPNSMKGGDNIANATTLQDVDVPGAIFVIRGERGNQTMVYTIRGLHTASASGSQRTYGIRIKMRNIGTPKSGENACTSAGNHLEIDVRKIGGSNQSYRDEPGMNGMLGRWNVVSPCGNNANGEWRQGLDQLNRYGDVITFEGSITINDGTADGFKIEIKPKGDFSNFINGIESIEVYGCLPEQLSGQTSFCVGTATTTTLSYIGSALGSDIKWYKGENEPNTATDTPIQIGNFATVPVPQSILAPPVRYWAVGSLGSEYLDVWAKYCCTGPGKVSVFKEDFTKYNTFNINCNGRQLATMEGHYTTYPPIEPLTNYRPPGSGTSVDGIPRRCDGLDDSYGIVKQADDLYNGFFTTPPIVSRTSGKQIMAVNAADAPGYFYQMDLQGVCSNTSYELSVWYAQVSVSVVKPMAIVLEVWQLNPLKLIASSNIFDETNGVEVPPNSKVKWNHDWHQATLGFNTPPGDEDKVFRLRMRNAGQGGEGNDFAIDEIEVTKCTATIYSYVFGTTSSTATVCSNGDLRLEASAAESIDWELIGDPVYIQWMETSIPNAADNQWTRTPIDSAPTTEKSITINPTTAAAPYTKYYRAKISADATRAANIGTLATGNCVATDVYTQIFTLIQTGGPTVTARDTTVCKGESAKFVGTTDATYWAWHTSSDTTSVGFPSWSSGTATKTYTPIANTAMSDNGKKYYFCVKKVDCFTFKEVTLTVEDCDELTLTKTASASTVCQNDNVTFTLTVSNTGSSAANNVEVTDLLPSGFTYVSHAPVISYNSGTGKWTIGALAAGANSVLTITAKATGSGNITNQAYISGVNGSTYNNYNAAEVKDDASVTIKALPVITGFKTPICVNETMNLLPNSGGTWVSSAPSVAGITNAGLVTGLLGGSTSFTFTNTTTNCSSATGNLTVNALPPTPIPSVNCDLGYGNGKVTVSPTGNYQYKLDGGYQSSEVFTGLANASNKTVTIKDNVTNCEATSAPFNISCGCTNGPTLSLSASNSSTCVNSSVTTNASFDGAGGVEIASISVSPNGGGAVTPATPITASGTTLTYTPVAADAGKTITVTITTNNPQGTPCVAAIAIWTITVDASLTPLVSISANPSGSVCTGTPVQYTASQVNGGTNPSYKWFVDGALQGGTSTFNYTPSDGENISCEMTSDLTCVTYATATSNIITADVTAINTFVAVLPTTVCVSAAISPNITIATTGATGINTAAITGLPAGVSANFSGDATAGTITISGTPAASGTFNYTIPLTGGCGNIDATGTIAVTASAIPKVSISQSPANACTGTPVEYIATPVGGGNPTYTWYVNNAQSGTGNPFNYTPSGGEDITCEMTSDLSCANPATASDKIVASVTAQLTPDVSISANPAGSVCVGTRVQYTAKPENGGINPTYRWYVNNTQHNETSNIFNYTPSDGEEIRCEMTSDLTCVTYATALSNMIIADVMANMSLSLNAIPDITIARPGQKILLQATNYTGATYVWTGNNKILENITASDYNVQLYKTTEFEVKVSDGVCINDDAKATLKISVEWPNAIMPNSGNDIFLPDIDDRTMMIFNRYGQKVFEGRGGWNGKYDGKNVEPGTYFYVIDLPDGDVQKATIEVVVVK